MELPSSIAMLVALVLTIGAKYVTTVRSVRLKEGVFEAESGVRGVRGQLKALLTEKAIAERDVKTLERQLNTLEQKLRLAKEEIANLRR